MNGSCRQFLKVFGTCVAAFAFGGGCAGSGATRTTESDPALAARVTAALRADPYFYSEHTEVSIENGAVVLTGLVQDERAIADAIDVAKKAAPGREIIDRFSIIKTSPH